MIFVVISISSSNDYCPAVAEDENYRKIFKEFPIFMKLLNLSYVLVFTGLASIAIFTIFKP
jgi:hypothetical protein